MLLLVILERRIRGLNAWGSTSFRFFGEFCSSGIPPSSRCLLVGVSLVSSVRYQWICLVIPFTTSVGYVNPGMAGMGVFISRTAIGLEGYLHLYLWRSQYAHAGSSLLQGRGGFALLQLVHFPRATYSPLNSLIDVFDGSTKKKIFWGLIDLS